MIDRQLIGDIGLAVLLAWPTVALSRQQPPAPEPSATAVPLVEQAALAEQTSDERRFTLEG